MMIFVELVPIKVHGHWGYNIITIAVQARRNVISAGGVIAALGSSTLQ